MSTLRLVDGPIAGQTPYAYSSEDLAPHRRILRTHYRQLVPGGHAVCGYCEEMWGANGCTAFHEAVTFDQVPHVKIEWRETPSLPDLRFDAVAEATTEVIYLDPAAFFYPAGRKPRPRPYPRSEKPVGVAA